MQAIGKILAGVTGSEAQTCVWLVSAIVAAYVFSGGTMSALLTDLVQGVMCLVILGVVMKEVLPVGVGLLGLLIVSFFAAAMSSADTYATTSSAMLVDYFYRRVLAPGKPRKHYLTAARLRVVVSILVAAVTTMYISGIKEYVKLAMSLLSFLGIPIYFGVVWRRANATGMWCSLGLGALTYLAVIWFTSTDDQFLNKDAYFQPAVFLSTAAALLGMWLGSLLGRPEDPLQLKRFYLLLATPIGREDRLIEAGIRTPSLIDAGLVESGPEQLDEAALNRLSNEAAADKLFGAESTIELRREPTLPWYFPGFIRITLACVALVVGTWLLTRVLFVWPT